MASRNISLDGLPEFTFEVHPSDDEFVSTDIIRNGAWEPFETTVIRRCLTSVSDFYDIGANIGWYSVVCGRELEKHGGTVHAFEPELENVLLLAKNTLQAQLSNVRINPCALGDTIGPIELHLSPTNKGDHRTYAAEPGRCLAPGCITRFDEYYVPKNRLPFVKIDTQGFEGAVIAGMGDYLFSIQGMTLLMEFWPHGLARKPDEIPRLLHLLKSANFVPLIVTEGDPHIRCTTWELLARAARSTLAPETGYFVNLLLHREGDGLQSRVRDLITDSPSHFVPEH